MVKRWLFVTVLCRPAVSKASVLKLMVVNAAFGIDWVALWLARQAGGFARKSRFESTRFPHEEAIPVPVTTVGNDE
jgi:hypothetical protein